MPKTQYLKPFNQLSNWRSVIIRLPRSSNSRLKRMVTRGSVKPMTVKAVPMLIGKERRKTFNCGKTRARIPRINPERRRMARRGALNCIPMEKIRAESSSRYGIAPPEILKAPGGNISYDLAAIWKKIKWPSMARNMRIANTF